MDSGTEWTRLVEKLLRLLSAVIGVTLILILLIIAWISGLFHHAGPNRTASIQTGESYGLWSFPSVETIPQNSYGDSIRYGRELIAHTASYLGPEGSIGKFSNGMNCQNCHLDAGTKPFGNNYALVASSYPRFRARSGSVETYEKRVNDCFERSMNGKPLNPESHEMKSIVAYMKWLGKDVKRETPPKTAGLPVLSYPDRKTDPLKGEVLYAEKCQTCHGQNGEGLRAPGQKEFTFPPLWGPQSYNTGAGLYRVSNFARFIFANMPLGATHDQTMISEEEAWDIAAFVNSMPHPVMDTSGDWPDISKKPVDHPFGPYADSFSEEQHKYGPFKPIIHAKSKR